MTLDSSKLIDFESTPLTDHLEEDSPPSVPPRGIRYTPTPVTLPAKPERAPVFQVSGPISLVPLDQLERPVIFPKPPAEMLEDERKSLEQKLPNINLGEAEKFLWLFYTCEFLEKGSSDDSDDLKTRLDVDFAMAGLTSHYQQLKNKQMWRAIRMLKIDMPPEIFTQCLNEMSEISTPQRFKLTQNLVTHIQENSFRAIPSHNGDSGKRVDSIQLEFLEQVKDIDELMEELGFEIDDPDESDEPLMVRSQEFDVRAQLTDELEAYSTEHESFIQLVDQLKEVDPSSVRERAKTGQTLTREELSTIVAAKKQKLEITQTLGRKWGDSLLLDGRNWPDDDARQTLLKLYDLASLDSPAISSAMSSWILEQHQKTDYHPQVVIDGSSFQGLLAVLTQVEAGADVILLPSSEPDFSPAEIIRLDPQWIEALRFHLGGQFDQLFTYVPALQYEGNSSGLIHSDGYGEISAGVLQQALWNQISALTKHDTCPLTVVTNTRVSDIEEPDQDDDRYLVHLEHRSNTGSNRTKIPADLLICAQKTPDLLYANYLKTDSPTDQTQTVANKGAQPKPLERLACRCAFLLPQSPTLTTPPGSRPFDTLVPDKPFRQSLVRNILDKLGHNAPALPGVREDIQKGIQLSLIQSREGFSPEYKLSRDLEKLHLSMKEKMHLKTVRCENRNSFQLDMELPPALCHFLNKAKENLEFLRATPEEIDIIHRQILAAWFETVSVQIQLPKRGIRPDNLRQESLSTYSPEKTFLEPPEHTMESHNSTLTITAIGPAAVHNPLRPEASQTAAREYVFNCQALTRKLAELHTSTGHLEHAEDLLEGTGDLAYSHDLLRTFVMKDD